MIRILAGCCVNQDQAVFAAHLSSLKWQTGGFQVDLAFVVDTSMPGAQGLEIERLMRDAGATVLLSDRKPEGAKYAVTSVTHDWSSVTFGWLGAQKQKLIDKARDEKYDALLLVDSDLLLSPDTLSSLWRTEKPCVSAVFWTKWTPGTPPLPQVWLSHPYELQGRGIEAHEFLGLLAQRQLVRVTGLGACTLLRADVLDKVGFQHVEGLPNHSMWQGEDRHFCINAARNHVEIYADAFPDVWHCYRPEDRVQIDAWIRNWEFQVPREDGSVRHCPTTIFSLNAGCQCGKWYCETFNPLLRASTGDLVSIIIEPLEEPQLAGYKQHIRGRLGAIRLLPQIEREVERMRAGDSAIIRVRFPLWWEIPEYRGQEKLVRISLVHCKPFVEHPTLGDTPAVHISEAFMSEAA